MTFEEILDRTLDMLQRRGRVSYRALKRQFELDDVYLDDLKAEIIDVLQVAVDQDNTMLVWTGSPDTLLASPLPAPPGASINGTETCWLPTSRQRLLSLSQLIREFHTGRREERACVGGHWPCRTRGRRG